MATYRITGPDGATYEITAPDGASEQDVLSFVQSQVGAAPKEMSWGDAASAAVENIPSSALRFGQSIAHAVTSPVETVSNLAKVGYGGLSKAAGAIGVPMDPASKAEREKEFDAVTEFFKDRYGGSENIKRTLADDPVGMAADLSAVLTGGTAALTRLPGAAGSAMRAVNKAGRAIDPVAGAVRGARAVGDKAVAPIVGMLTGTGGDALRTAAKAGQSNNAAFVENIRGRGGVDDIPDMARSALNEMRKERSAAYKANMASVGAEGSQALVNERPILQSLKDARDGVYFRGVAKDAEAAKVLSDIEAKLTEFRELPMGAYRTPEGMDALKQAIGEIRQRTQPRTLARRAADQVYNTVKKEIVRQVPSYAKAMAEYARASDVLQELERTFSLGEKASKDTAVRKLQSVMRNNVNTNYGRRTKQLSELARHEPDLPFALAGQQLSSATPRGLQSLAASGIGGIGIGGAAGFFGNPAALAVLPFMSPRLMGEAAYGIGRGASLLENAPRAVGVNPSSIPPWLLAAYQAGNIGQAAQGGLLALPGAMDAGLLGGN